MLKYFVLAALLQITWGIVPPASKLVIDEIPIELYIALRWTISSAVFTAVWILKPKWRGSWMNSDRKNGNFKISNLDWNWRKFRFSNKSTPFPLSQLGPTVCLGALGYGVASLGTLYGLKIGGVVNFALMSSLSPMITSAASILILREKPKHHFYLALAISVLGLCLLVQGRYQISSLWIAVVTAGLILGAYLLEAFVFVGSKRLKTSLSTLEYLVITQTSASLVMWILQFTIFHQTSELSSLSTNGWMAVVFVSIVGCVFGYALLYWLLKKVDGHKLALFEGLHAISAALIGYSFFQEEVSKSMWIGGSLILIGLTFGLWSDSLSNNEKAKAHAAA